MTPTEPWRSIDAYLGAKGVRYGSPTVGQTTGGKHTPGSLHYAGRARDYGRSDSDLPTILNELLPFAVGPDYRLQELYGLSTYWKHGRVITPSADLRASHQDHVHAALREHATLPRPSRPLPEEPVMPDDNPDVPNITGPVELHLVIAVSGMCTGYYIFSPTTGEIHAHGPGATYHGRSEVISK